MCGGEFYPSYDDTEDICEFCQPGEEQDHDRCDWLIEEACACRNSDHILTNPAAMYEKYFGKYMEAAKAKLDEKERIR